MPILSSAKKQMRQNAKRKSRNDRSKSLYREIRVGFSRAIKQGDVAQAQASLPKLFSAIDTLAKKNIYPPNRAARRKSLFHRMLKNLSTAKKES